MNGNDRELQGLMNAQLDGVATAEESERLSRALESREGLRSEYRKLSGVFAALSRLEMEEPPASLKQGVLRTIRTNEAPAGARETWLQTITALIREKVGFRYAYSFAAGAALGVMAFAILSGNLMTRQGTDFRPFTGTMAPLDGPYGHRSSHVFGLRDGHVQAEALSGKDGLVARLTADAPPGSELAVSFDPGDWSVVAVRQEPAGNDVSLGTGRLSVRIQRSGQSQYFLYLGRRGAAGSPLRIAIHSPGGSVQGELETGAPPSGG
jgi:hypothetical protein